MRSFSAVQEGAGGMHGGFFYFTLKIYEKRDKIYAENSW
jgi:hypothetical protein